MKLLRRSNDLVYLSFAEAMLRAQGFSPLILDEAISAAEGSIGALPRRLVVQQEEAEAAARLLEELDREYANH